MLRTKGMMQGGRTIVIRYVDIRTYLNQPLDYVVALACRGQHQRSLAAGPTPSIRVRAYVQQVLHALQRATR